MFSGIIFDKGRVKSAVLRGSGLKMLEVAVARNIPAPQKGMSIAVNGICLTVTGFKGKKVFTADITKESCDKSTLGGVKAGAEVNIEYPVTASSMMSGHIVQGHVDATGKVRQFLQQGGNTTLEIEYPANFSGYMVEKGSVAVDGISLTAFEVKEASFKAAVIPDTFENTIVKNYSRGTPVNLEFDIIGKYVEKQLKNRKEGI